MLFTLIVAAKGHGAVEVERTDPRAGAVKVSLKAHDLDRRDSSLIVRGRVLDERGKPVPHATITPTGRRADGRTSFGTISDADRLAITDEHGDFRMGLAKPMDALYVTVRAPFLAPLQSGPLKPGAARNDLTLVEGVTVQGKVVKGTKPVAGGTLRLTQNTRTDVEPRRDRSMIELTFEIDTDEQGNFRFLNVPPEEEYGLIGVMDGFRTHGALKVRPVVVKENRTTCDVGTLLAQNGSVLSGLLALSDGKAVPAGTKVFLTRRAELAYDCQITTVEADGRFVFRGVPDEQCQLTATIKGYSVSHANFSCDRYHGRGLWGRVDRDITDLRFLFDPGEFVGMRIGDPKARELSRRRESRMQGAPALLEKTGGNP